MGHKKAAALHGLTKAERKALERREAELAAELAARKAAKTKGKGKSKAKGKGVDFAKLAADVKAERKAERKAAEKAARKAAKTEAPELTDVERAVIADAKAEREAARQAAVASPAKPAKGKSKSAKAKVEAAAAAAIATPSSEGARAAAETAAEAAAEASDDETDEQIRARVLAKRKAREADEANRAINGVTSTPEALDALAEPTPEKIAKAKAAAKAVKAAAQAVADLTADAPGDGGEALEEAALVAKIDAKTTVEVVETEQGRAFVAGADDAEHPVVRDDDFAMPSEAGKPDFETNGNNQYKVKRPSDGKVVGYTRATTYIANLEDRSNLEKWKLRMLLEGVAVNDHPDESGRIDEPVVATMRDLIHVRDVAIAKARKADRKGKLVTGQLAVIVEGAWADFKRAVNALAEELLETGGAHAAADKGTNLHELFELHDREGIDAVGELLTEGKITPADLADVEAYAEAIKRAGIKIIDIERPVVNDELKVGGRLDRTAMVKFPGMVRATRCVADIKTGRIDYSPGKLAQQLEMYASSQGYDLDTDEREDLKLSPTKAIVIHVPAGSGTAFVYPVDLSLGRKGNRLSGEVRAWRNEGKRAVDFKTDLAKPEAV